MCVCILLVLMFRCFVFVWLYTVCLVFGNVCLLFGVRVLFGCLRFIWFVRMDFRGLPLDACCFDFVWFSCFASDVG